MGGQKNQKNRILATWDMVSDYQYFLASFKNPIEYYKS